MVEGKRLGKWDEKRMLKKQLSETGQRAFKFDGVDKECVEFVFESIRMRKNMARLNKQADCIRFFKRDRDGFDKFMKGRGVSYLEPGREGGFHLWTEVFHFREMNTIEVGVVGFNFLRRLSKKKLEEGFSGKYSLIKFDPFKSKDFPRWVKDLPTAFETKLESEVFEQIDFGTMLF